jgi:peptidyl-prolyl cis-trans isomerase C
MQVTCSHILVPTLEQAQDLHTRIVAGANFAQMAMEHSLCNSASVGGNLGAFGPGQMVPEFEQVAFACPVNAMSQPVQTQFGYHLILRTA